MEQPAVISLHGRTLQQMYRGEADWNAIAQAAEIVRGSGTLLFGNGDVHSYHDVVCRVRDTGVDGVLVGRAVLGAPWFFRQKEEARLVLQQQRPEDGLEPWVPRLDVRFEVLLDHARRFEAASGQGQFRRMRKHLGWYCKGFLMPLRFEPICSESLQSLTWSRSSPIFAWTAQVSPGYLTR